jgi:hypothetical protein
MHSRMRHRVAEFQKILNRAKTEVATTEKKTVRLVLEFDPKYLRYSYTSQWEDDGNSIKKYIIQTLGDCLSSIQKLSRK